MQKLEDGEANKRLQHNQHAAGSDDDVDPVRSQIL